MKFEAGPFEATRDDSGDRDGWWIDLAHGSEEFVPTSELDSLFRLVDKLRKHEERRRDRAGRGT